MPTDFMDSVGMFSYYCCVCKALLQTSLTMVSISLLATRKSSTFSVITLCATAAWKA